MNTKLSPAIVGMFILGALLLAVVAFLSFGGTNFFAKPARFVVYFSESAAGLDPGAGVKINGVRILGNPREKVSVISFVVKDRKTEEVGRLLDQEGIAVRSGHHCAQPSLRRFGVESSVRPSFAFYNTFEEIDRLAAAVRDIAKN